MKSSSSPSFRFWFPALLAVSSLAAPAAPRLQVNGPSGAGITMEPHIVSWGNSMADHPATNGLESIDSIFAGGSFSGTISSDGKPRVWENSSNNPVGIPTDWTPARILASTDYINAVCKTDGTVLVLSPPAGSIFFPPAGLSGVIGLAAGGSHFAALKNDGTVVAWGNNAYGQTAVPGGLANVTAIAAGQAHNLAVKQDGSVVAWGINQNGQSSIPAGLSGVTAVAAGTSHSLALKSDGTVVSWGGVQGSSLSPPAGLAGVTAIAAGSLYSAALTSNGNVTVWGSGYHGVMTPPPELGRVSKIAGGNSHITAVTSRSEDPFGPVGWNVGATRIYTLRNVGTETLSLSNIVKSGKSPGDFTIAPSLLPTLDPGQSTEFTISFMPDGNGLRSALIQIPSNDPEQPVFEFCVSGYGFNLPPVAYAHDDVEMTEDEAVEIELAASDPNGDPIIYHFTDFQTGIGIEPLGENRFRVVPDKNFHGRSSFTFFAKDTLSEESNRIAVSVAITPVNDPPVVIAPWEPVVVRKTSASGANASFMVGAHDVEDGVLVTEITADGQAVSSGAFFPTGDTTVEVAATDSDGVSNRVSFVVRVLDSPDIQLEDDGLRVAERQLLTVWGFPESPAVKAVPPGLSEVIGITASDSSSFALRPDGSIAAWGAENIVTVPADLTGVRRIEAGRWHAIALRGDGTVVSWGDNSFGQIDIPVGLAEVTAVAAGNTHTLALHSNGSVTAWGDDGRGQSTLPQGLDNIVAIAAGGMHSLALRADGRVVGWGSNISGESEVPDDLVGVVAIAAGSSHSLALLADGSLRGWGSNYRGETTPSAGSTPLRAISARNGSSMGLKADHTFAIWGDKRDTMLSPSDLSRLRRISISSSHAMVTRAAPALFSFGTHLVYGPRKKVLTVRNTGSSALELASFEKTGAHAADFTIDSSETAHELLPGESTTLSVTFLPLASGLREATLRISSNDVEKPALDVILSGSWNNSAPVAADVGPLVCDEDTGPLEITLPATDINGNALSISIVSPPAPSAGSLGPVTGDKVTFTPAPDFNGTASFTFKANDGFSESNIATVQLQVLPVNDPPVLKLPVSPVSVQTLGTTGLPDYFLEGTDLEDGRLTVFLTHNGEPVANDYPFPIGDTVVHATVTDKNGGTVTGSFIVRVVAGPDMLLEADGAGSLPRLSGATAWGGNSFRQLEIPAGLGNLAKLRAGSFHTLALQEDGKVLAWGRNYGGETTVPAHLENLKDIGAGWSYSCVLKADGTLEPWGTDMDPQLVPPLDLRPAAAMACAETYIVVRHHDGTLSAWGDSSFEQTNPPVGLNGVIAIAAGALHAAALKEDGTVITWGSPQAGTPPAGLAGVKSIACGGSHTLALLQNGTVVAWGNNSKGQCNIPSGLSGVRAIATGLHHSLAIKTDGSIVAWGNNSDGQSSVPQGLGDAKIVTAGDRHTVAYVAKPSYLAFGAVSTTAPSTRTFTIRNQGQGALEIEDFELTGADATFFQLQPAGMDEHLETGESTTFTVTFAPGRNGAHEANLRLITNDTTRPRWDLALTGHGFNGSPQAPAVSGIITPEDTPVSIHLPASDPEGDPLAFGITSLTPPDAGSFGTVANQTVAFTPKANFNGQVSFVYRASDGGTNSEGAVSLTVTPVNDAPTFNYLPGIIRVFTPEAAGTGVNFRMPTISDVEDGAITASLTLEGQPVVATSIFPLGTSTVVAKGTDSEGAAVQANISIQVVNTSGPSMRLETSDGGNLPRPPAVLEWSRYTSFSGTIPPDLRGVKQIAAGDDHAVVLRNDGTLFAWGGANMNRLAIPADLTNSTKIACGANHTLALKSTGVVVAWGNNSYGQCTIPAGLSGITAIAAGGNASMALKSNGTVVVWGDTLGGSYNPPAGLGGITGIAAGKGHFLALKTDGKVVAWGSNSRGQASVPGSLSGVIAIAAGTEHSAALKSDGTVVVWGSATSGQHPVPGGLADVAAISAGPYHTMALKSDGSVAAWGSYQMVIPIAALPAEVKDVTATAGGNGRLFAATNNPYSLDFAKVGADRTLTRTVQIHNRGTTPLIISSIGRTSGSTRFTVSTTGMASSVPAGQSTSFTITFSPDAQGPQTARFRINSNDRYEPAMELLTTAEGVSPYDGWAHAAGLSGNNASPDAEPFGDGLANLVKYAFNMNGGGPDHRQLTPGTGTSGLPHISVEGSGDHSFIRVEFVRRRAGTVQYEVQATADLNQEFQDVQLLPEVVPIDDTWERVIVRKPFNPGVEPTGFARVKLTF